MTDLTERLRKGRLVKAADTITLTVNGEEIEASTGEIRELCHPDALEAATTLETLTQENARLREEIGRALSVPLQRLAEIERDGMPQGWEPLSDDDGMMIRVGDLRNIRKALGGGDE